MRTSFAIEPTRSSTMRVNQTGQTRLIQSWYSVGYGLAVHVQGFGSTTHVCLVLALHAHVPSRVVPCGFQGEQLARLS